MRLCLGCSHSKFYWVRLIMLFVNVSPHCFLFKRCQTLQIFIILGTQYNFKELHRNFHFFSFQLGHLILNSLQSKFHSYMHEKFNDTIHLQETKYRKETLLHYEKCNKMTFMIRLVTGCIHQIKTKKPILLH